MAGSYEDQYTWGSGFKIPGTAFEGMEHSDGSVSLAIVWDGYSTELASADSVNAALQSYAKALQGLSDSNVVFENHFLREFDDSVCRAYVDYGEKKTVRHHELSRFIRREMAATIGEMAMENTLVTIVTLPRTVSPLAGLFPKRALKYQRAAANRLLDAAHELLVQLPGARLLSYAELERFIWRVYHRDLGRAGRTPDINNRFKLSDRLARKPSEENGLLRLGKTFTKVALVLDYPDANPNWFYQIANRCGVEIHVTQIFGLASAAGEMMKSARQTEKAVESATEIGGENEAGKVRDHNAFRTFVSDNNLKLFNNCFIIKLHHVNPEELNDIYRRFKNTLGENMVFSDDNADVAYLYWRVSQPAQGYRTAFLRPDHSLQVANMAPVIQFKSGDKKHPHCLRITSDAKAVTFGYPPGGTNHQITAAKTGSGKGVENVAKIGELYPLGVNFYITEVGASYKWIVEAFGGDYYHLDPNSTVISPFPSYAFTRPDDDPDQPLPSDIVEPTIGALLPLLSRGGKAEIGHHIKSVAEQIMQAMYALADPSDGKKGPSLADFFLFANEARSEFSGTQQIAANVMCENLDSFLSSTAGSNFVKADSLNFDAGIVGVDFKPLMQNEELAKFLLVFIALRYKQLAFANATPARIMIDELHEFERIDRDLITTLIKQLTRMGRKEAGAYHGISQEMMDNALEPGILNQITHREFMYMQSGHKEAGQLYRINDRALHRWQSFNDPEAAGSHMNYRQCLRMVGDDCFDLHLKFPSSLLDLAHSSPQALQLKNAIGAKTNDPFERLKLFREAITTMEAAG